MATAESRPSGRRLDLLLTLALAAAAPAIWAPLLRVGLDLGDEGWLVTAIERISAGESLYRDIFRSYGPGVYAPFVPLFRWMEPNLVIVRAVWLAGLVALCVGSYWLARPFAPRWAALGAGALPMVIRAPVHKTFVPLAYLATLWLCSRLAEREHGPGKLIALGAGFGIVGLVRQEAGAYGMLIGLATLAAFPASRSRPGSGSVTRAWSALRGGLLLGAGAAAVWLPLLIFWAAQGVLGDVLQQLVLQGAQGNAALSLPFPSLERLVTGPGRLTTLLFYIPAASVAAGALMLLQAARRRNRSTETIVVAQWTAIALLSHSIFLSRTDDLHLTQALVAPALLWACAAGHLARAFRPGPEGAGPVWIRLALAVLVAAPLAAIPLGVEDIIENYTDRSQGVELEMARAPVIVPDWQAEEVRDTVEAIRRKTPAGEPIFVAPYAPGLYFLAERRNPSRHDAIVPGFATPGIQREVIEALGREKVPLVVIRLTEAGGKARWWIPSFAPGLWRHIRVNYVQEETIGRFVLLRRRSSTPLGDLRSPEISDPIRDVETAIRRDARRRTGDEVD
jgi:hypothetical protein